MKNKVSAIKSIKVKLIISFVSLLVISMLLMGIANYAVVVNQTKIDYTNSIHKELIHVNNGIENQLELIQANTHMLSQNSLFKEVDSRITSYVDKEDPSGMNEMTPL